jgi:hypothetical protein
MKTQHRFLLGASLAVAACLQSPAQNPGDIVHIKVDAGVGRHPIDPLIYGVNSGTTHQLQVLRAPLNRSGGDSAEVYNYEIDARNSGRDWFFESYACNPDILQQYGDSFVALSRRAGSQAMLTIPMVGWVAKLGPNRTRLAGYSILKYGLQRATDKDGFAEAGDGVTLDGKFITNDPNDAMMPDSFDRETKWMRRNIARWKLASQGGIQYYLLGNEPGRWHDIHRDVHPVGTHASELAAKTVALGNMVHAIDPYARVLAPEEWTPAATIESGFDMQIRETNSNATPDRVRETGGMDLMPWLLGKWKAAGHPVDIVSVHYYPQNGEYSDDVSEKMQLLRNRSTRGLWDRNYHDVSWMSTNTALIPTLRETVDHYYQAGAPIAITEYSWGAEKHMNGATTQADIFGIFGRENLSMATRWIAPAENTPTFLAMKLFRNYDDRGNGFGDTSVSATAPNVDLVSAFAALRARDNAITVMLVNKQLNDPAPADIALSGVKARGTVETVQLVNGKLVTLPSRPFRGGAVQTVLPSQSVTLLIIHAS